MAKIRINIGGNAVILGGYSDVVEIDEDELEGLSKTERAIALTQTAEDAVDNVVEWGWEEIEEPGSE